MTMHFEIAQQIIRMRAAEKHRINPVYVQKGYYRMKYMLVFFLGLVAISGIYLLREVGFPALFLILSALFGITVIRFASVSVYQDHFVIEKKSVLKAMSECEKFYFDAISEIRFCEGSVNRSQLILQTALGEGMQGGFSAPDQMQMVFRDSKLRVIYRIGDKTDFKKTINKLQKMLSNHLESSISNTDTAPAK